MSRVTQLAPTNGIEDPHVRAFCDSLANAWGLRNGEINAEGGDRFITKAEFESEVASALRGLIGSSRGTGVPGFPTTTRPSDGNLPEFPPGWTVEDGYRELAEMVRQSWLWQHLGERFLKDNLIPYISGKISPLESVSEAAIKRVGVAEAGIATEISERVNNDGAFVTAINTIWAAFGSSQQAVVQTGTSVASNAVASQATTWSNVQVAVRDPVTGQVATTGILQETRAYDNAIDDTLRATWSVRIETHPGSGESYVGGFGLTMSGDRDASLGYSPGPQYDFGVRADKFWIGAVSGPNTSKNVPFIVVTAPGTVNGVYYPEGGVWMNAAMICNATIDIAKIVKVIYSANFNGTKDNTAGTVDINNPGTTGWALGQDGNVVLNNVVARGTIYANAGVIKRLTVTGALSGSVSVPNNTTATVNLNMTDRDGSTLPIVTVWCPDGAAVLTNVTASTFSVRVDFAGDTTAYYSYF